MPTWRFVYPRADGTVSDVTIGAVTLFDAFDQYRAFYWSVDTTEAVGVWMGHCLCARVVPVFSRETQANEPRLEVWR